MFKSRKSPPKPAFYSALMSNRNEMYGLDHPEIKSQVFRSRPMTSKTSSRVYSGRAIDKRKSISPSQGVVSESNQYANSTLITAVRPSSPTIPKRLNVKSARTFSRKKFSHSVKPFNMMTEMVRISHEKELLKEYGTVVDPNKFKRHPSVIENIRPASYRLYYNNLFRPNNTKFSIFTRSLPVEAASSTGGDTQRSLVDKSNTNPIDSMKELQRQQTSRSLKPQVQKQEHEQKEHEGMALRNFQFMSIKELKKHEKGILNLYEDEKKKYHFHNKIDENALFDIKLTNEEYESIFDGPPSFYEKKAFIETFRRKWREDHGHCSLFDRRGYYKEARDKYTVRRANWQIPPRQNFKNIERVLNPERVYETLNTHFSSSFLGGEGVQDNIINLSSQTIPEFYKTRNGLPKNGLRRSLKPSQQGKNFTMAGHTVHIKTRPTSVRKLPERPKSKYERTIRKPAAERPVLRQESSQQIINQGSSVMIGGQSSLAQSQANMSQVITYHESEGVSPIAGARGLIDDHIRHGGSNIVSVPKTDLRDSIESSSNTAKQSQRNKGGSLGSKRSSQIKSQSSVEEKEVDVKQMYFKVQKGGSSKTQDNIGPQQISELSAGSSYTNTGFPLMPNNDMPLSGKTQGSQESIEEVGTQKQVKMFKFKQNH